MVDKLPEEKWRQFGEELGMAAEELNELADETPETCWNEVIDHWLESDEHSSTWEVLYSLLNKVECSDVAKDMMTALSTGKLLNCVHVSWHYRH